MLFSQICVCVFLSAVVSWAAAWLELVLSSIRYQEEVEKNKILIACAQPTRPYI